jgi:transcriptional regulator with XRE-family HTH domain
MRQVPARQPNRLWIARHRSGLGQKTVARLLGHKSTSTISEYETGRLLPSLPTAMRLAAVYGRPITELYPDLYRAIQEEIQEARPVTRVGEDPVQQSAFHL